MLTFNSGLKIAVLAPVDISSDINEDANSHSLVLMLEYLGYEILLTGDMEVEEMEDISDRGASWGADFLKIPHHGSKGSLDRDWFDQINPLAVFVSVGVNRFGHPAQEVLAYWEERKIPVYRTDYHGTIRLVIDKRGYRVIPGRATPDS